MIDREATQRIAAAAALDGSAASLAEPVADALPWRVAMEMIGDAVLFFSLPEFEVIDTNLAACEHLGYSREELLSMHVGQLVPGWRPGVMRWSISKYGAQIGGRRSLRLRVRTADSFKQAIATMQRVETESGPGLVVVGRELPDDWSPRAVPVEALADDLTRLPRRSVLVQQLHNALLRTETDHGGVGVLFVDVDYFKRVNDTHGHVVGDQVLQAIAERIVNNVRHGDLVTRFGGDEFLVLIDDVESRRELVQLVDRLSRAIKAPLEIGGRLFKITASIGIAVGGGETRPQTLIERADAAMYRAKSLGRNGKWYFEPARSVERS